MSVSRGRWLEIGARSVSAGAREALLTEGLLALGGRAVVEADGWHLTHVEEPSDVDVFVAGARTLLADVTGLSDVEIRTTWREHEDWAETWKRGLGPRRMTDRLIVTQSWCPVAPEEQGAVLVLDPGMAFGTAEHGTTRGCLRLLDRALTQGERVLDVGSGSGILAIAAALLGAAEAVALEGDPLAIEALTENVERNHVADRVQWRAIWADPSVLRELAPRDGILANIETGTLRPLLRAFAAALVEGGWLILSGILASEWSEMRTDVEAAGLALVELDEDGEWRSAWFTRPRERRVRRAHRIAEDEAVRRMVASRGGGG